MGLGPTFGEWANNPGQGLADIRPKEQSGTVWPRQLPPIRTPTRPQLFPAVGVGTKEGWLHRLVLGPLHSPSPEGFLPAGLRAGFLCG